MANCRLLLTVLFYAWKWEEVGSCLGSRPRPSVITTTQRYTTASKKQSTTPFSHNGYLNTALITATTVQYTTTAKAQRYNTSQHELLTTKSTEQSLPPDSLQDPFSDTVVIALIFAIAVVIFIMLALIVMTTIRKRRTAIPVNNGVERNQSQILPLYARVVKPRFQRHLEPMYVNTMNRKPLVKNEEPMYSDVTSVVIDTSRASPLPARTTAEELVYCEVQFGDIASAKMSARPSIELNEVTTYAIVDVQH